jgi:hypothetical protein
MNLPLPLRLRAGCTGPRAVDLLAMVLLALYWCIFVSASSGWLQQSLVDDAYIFLRVAENVRAGIGWTYNAGSSVNPITSPLYAGLLAAAGATLPLDGPAVVSLVYLAGLIALSAGIYFGLRQYCPLLALAAAVAVSSSSVPVKSWGMETSVFLASIVWGMLAYCRGRQAVAGLFCGLAALSRPEGIVLAGIMQAAHLVRTRRVAWSLLGACAAALAPWLLYAWAAGVQVIPNSVFVKAVQSTTGLWRSKPPWLVYFLGQPSLPWVSYPLAALGAVRAARDYARGQPFVLLVFCFGAVQVAAYSTLKAPVGYFWYLAPGNLALDMAIALGAFTMCRSIVGFARTGKAQNAEEPVVAAALAAVVFVVMLTFPAAPFTRPGPYRMGSQYRAAGLWIERMTPAGHAVAAAEIGYIGYFSKRPIRDIHGLIHPEALEHLRRGDWGWWFTSDPPPVIVLHNPPFKGELAEGRGWADQSMREFRDRYRRVKSFGNIDVYLRD